MKSVQGQFLGLARLRLPLPSFSEEPWVECRGNAPCVYSRTWGIVVFLFVVLNPMISSPGSMLAKMLILKVSPSETEDAAGERVIDVAPVYRAGKKTKARAKSNKLIFVNLIMVCTSLTKSVDSKWPLYFPQIPGPVMRLRKIR